jgi:glycosyltransferase involved in cell wall biosynthesis
MEYVAQGLAVQPLYIDELQREISAAPDAFAVRRLVQLIREQRPDILHTHTAKAGAVGRAAALLAGPARPPVVVHTFHGHVLRGYFTPARARAFQSIEQMLARSSDALIAVSPQVRDDLVRLGVAPAGKIAVIRLGLDLEQRIASNRTSLGAVRAELGVPEEGFLIGWLGRMTEIKRVDDLLAAFAALRAEGADAYLALVGDGPLRLALEGAAARFGIADRTRFVGFRESVGEFYAAFDAVALTSANEGTPVSVIEALASGLPVVSTDVGGVADVVQDGRSGFLVPAGDVPAIVRGLRRLAEDPDLRRRMGEHGRLFVVPRYSVPRLVEDMDRLYGTLLQQRKPREHRIITALDRPLTPTLPAAATATPARRRSRQRLRVILLSQYFPPEVGATQSRVQAFAEYLAAQGHAVTVICEFPNHPHGVIPEIYRGKIYQDDRSNPYRVLRVRVLASAEKTQLTRMRFYLSYMSLAAAVAPLAGRADVVFATSPPLFTGVVGLAVARYNRAPLVLDVRDLWPAAAVSLSQMGGGLSLEIATWLEKLLYRQASVVTAVTRPFCAAIDAARQRGPAAVLLPNGTLDAFFVEDEASERLGSSDDFLVTFAGTHGIAQALPSVLDAADRLDGSARIALVGEGPVKPLLVEEAQRRELGNVEFHAQRSPTNIPAVLRGSDALLVPLSAHPTFADFVPSKMIDFMAVGRPVVLSAQGEAARILAAAGAGVAVPPENPEALAGAIRWLSAHPDAASEMGKRGKEYARRRLRGVQAERLEEVLLDCVAMQGEAAQALRRAEH